MSPRLNRDLPINGENSMNDKDPNHLEPRSKPLTNQGFSMSREEYIDERKMNKVRQSMEPFLQVIEKTINELSSKMKGVKRYHPHNKRRLERKKLLEKLKDKIQFSCKPRQERLQEFNNFSYGNERVDTQDKFYTEFKVSSPPYCYHS